MCSWIFIVIWQQIYYQYILNGICPNMWGKFVYKSLAISSVNFLITNKICIPVLQNKTTNFWVINVNFIFHLYWCGENNWIIWHRCEKCNTYVISSKKWRKLRLYSLAFKHEIKTYLILVEVILSDYTTSLAAFYQKTFVSYVSPPAQNQYIFQFLFKYI
jgi:hypothetical protein